MITRFATFTSQLAVALTMMLAIAACGGGGGGGGSDGGFLGPGGGGSGDTLFLTVELKDSDGNPTNTVSASSPATLQVAVTENGSRGRAVPDVIVRASTDSGLLFPSSGSKLTNSEGLVTFRVEADDTRGAGTITVSVTDENGNNVQETVNFQLGQEGLRLGYLLGGDFFDAEIGIAPGGVISAGGQAVLSLALVDEQGNLVGSAESIRITSACLSAGTATLDPANPIAVATGQVSVTYTANGCEGNDALTAEIIGDGAMAFGDIEVASPSANSLTFASATPRLIVLRGTGGGGQRVEKSQVVFRTVGADSQPVSGVEVNFGLTTDIGGLSINPTTAFSNDAGEVTTVVSSGDVATVVRVTATSDAGNGSGEVSAVSDVLTVSTGLPDQNSISLSVEKSFVVEEAFTVDGVTRNLTVRMADKFNNPVPDGTAAVFTTEYGSIQPACETNGGACTVVWTSQAPRLPTLDDNQDRVLTINDNGYSCPSHTATRGPCPDDLGMIRGGRSTVLVTAIGEESFIDANGNGVFDRKEANNGLFSNLTEAFLDVNENGRYDPATEFCKQNKGSLTCKAGREDLFADFNSNGAFDANGDDPDNGYPDEGVDAIYNGLLCPHKGNIAAPDFNPDGWCSRELVNVRDTAVLILSADPNWDIGLFRGRSQAINGTSGGITYDVYVSDIFNNKPTAGSTVNVSAGGVCEIDGESRFEVPNTTAPGAFAFSFTQGGTVEYDSCSDPFPDLNDILTITLTPQDGGPDYSETFVCRASAVNTAELPCPDDGG